MRKELRREELDEREIGKLKRLARNLCHDLKMTFDYHDVEYKVSKDGVVMLWTMSCNTCLGFIYDPKENRLSLMIERAGNLGAAERDELLDFFDEWMGCGILCCYKMEIEQTTEEDEDEDESNRVKRTESDVYEWRSDEVKATELLEMLVNAGSFVGQKPYWDLQVFGERKASEYRSEAVRQAYHDGVNRLRHKQQQLSVVACTA